MIDIDSARKLITALRAQASALDATATSLEASLAWLESANVAKENYEKTFGSVMSMWQGFIPVQKT